VRRLHNELVDLAFLKHRIRLGRADQSELVRRRQRVASLRKVLALAGSDAWAPA
jgi:hypothetical protein